MTFDPPMRLWNGVEVTAINPAVRGMSLVVYVDQYTNTTVMHDYINGKVHNVIRYLVMEGYIPTYQGWTVNSGLVVKTS